MGYADAIYTYIILPIIKYKVIPSMSFKVVTNGPVASAGSISFLSSKSGISVPNIEAKIMTENKAILTVMLSANESLKKKL